MNVGLRILELARAAGARSIFVVGTGKGVGKSTTLGAIYEAAWGAGLHTGIASIGHKPRWRLRPQTLFATARALLPASPACQILAAPHLTSAAGALLYARTVFDGEYDLIGPSSASALRESIAELERRCEIVLVDGAIDRIATLAASDGAIVVACGAAAATTPAEAVAGAAALTARLQIAPATPGADAIELQGALTATTAAALIAAGEQREIVVRDATQIVMSGTSLAQALARLRVRCRRPLRVVAATVCALAPERFFEPAAFLREVGEATGVPAFDVFAGAAA
ncbi:MAG TPA: hypothetical protein VHS56_01980 [Candidatus Cybelea sp.]|nr:hypothetical protein [Candidatus Cybelea sp.]